MEISSILAALSEGGYVRFLPPFETAAMPLPRAVRGASGIKAPLNLKIHSKIKKKEKKQRGRREFGAVKPCPFTVASFVGNKPLFVFSYI